jgi:hypothetical protein
MRTVLVGALLTALAASGCATIEAESQAVAGYDFSSLDKVAIVEVTGRVYGEAVKNQIANMFVMELMQRGYTVIERSQVKELLKEQEFQASDISSNEGAAQAGKILNVPAVMLIDIPKYAEQMSMTAKLIEVETATILWIGQGRGSTGRTAATILGAVGGAAAGAVLGGGDTRDRVAGGVIGGVVGGIAGSLLSPDEESHVRRVVDKITARMPPRIPMATQRR